MKQTNIELAKKRLLDRYNRYLSSKNEHKYLFVLELWRFLNSDSYFSIISNKIRNESNYEQIRFARVPLIFKEPDLRMPEKEDEKITFIYSIFDFIVKENNVIQNINNLNSFIDKANLFPEQADFNLFNNLYLEPLVYYFYEEVDVFIETLTLLLKFKSRVEWFDYGELREMVKKDTPSGESNLSRKLYKYLFDQGAEIEIEPLSPKGRIDLIARQSNSKKKFLVEIKLIKEQSDKSSKCKAGLKQILNYCNKYNENEGYLVIFNSSELDITTNLKETFNSIPFIKVNNKYCYIIIINLNVPEQASRIKVKSIELTEEDFLTEL